jgi:hypothetical protein
MWIVSVVFWYSLFGLLINIPYVSLPRTVLYNRPGDPSQLSDLVVVQRYTPPVSYEPN